MYFQSTFNVTVQWSLMMALSNLSFLCLEHYQEVIDSLDALDCFLKKTSVGVGKYSTSGEIRLKLIKCPVLWKE